MGNSKTFASGSLQQRHIGDLLKGRVVTVPLSPEGVLAVRSTKPEAPVSASPAGKTPPRFTVDLSEGWALS